jgi:predicted Holliday junction resolvase-like endonuclease
LDKLDGTTSIEEKDNDDPDSSILAEIKTAKATLELKKLQLELQKLSAEAEGWTFNKIKETKEQIQKDTELLQKRGTELKLLEQTLITKQSNVPVISLIECSAATRMKEIEVPERLYEVLVSAWKETDHVNLWGFILELYHDWDKELYADSKLDSQRTDFDDEMEELEKRTEDNKISQRATLKGQKIEMWVPYLSEFPYDNGDVIPIKDSVDFITLNGRTKQHITDILFQDVQTGDRADYIPPSSNKGMVKKFIEELNNPHLRFELYARGDTDDTFHLVNHNH